MASKNVVLKDTFGNQIFPATTAEQVSYDATKNMKQALDTVNAHASVANKAADMTDETKIYVYTGSETGYTFGHWYYYDESAWTDGGEYMSGDTDESLSVAGRSADAKATGDEISALKEDLYVTVLDGYNVVNSKIIRQNNNTAVVNNNDGSYTIGTTDYGLTWFGNSVILPAGVYQLNGTEKGFMFVSDTNDFNDRFIENSGQTEKQFTLDSETTCYLGFRISAKPAESFTLIPYIKTAITTKENRKRIDGINSVLGAANGVLHILPDHIVTSKNVLKNTGYTEGYYFNPDGTQTANASYKCSDYFVIKPNTQYYIYNSNGTIIFYTADKTFITGANINADNTIISPATAAFARYSTNGTVGSWNISEGSEYINTPYFDPYFISNNFTLSPYYKGEFTVNKADVHQWYEGYIENYAALGFSLNTKYSEIIALFDGLMNDAESGYVTKTAIGTAEGTDEQGNTYTLYEYAFVPRNLTENLAKKKHPKILIDCAIHGFEKNSTFAFYCLLYDVIHNWTKNNFLATLRNFVEIRIVPVSNPWGFDRQERNNANGVNLNRNFPCPNWTVVESGANASGDEPLNQAEAAALAQWLDNNSDMWFYFNVHTNGHYYANGYANAMIDMPYNDVPDEYYNKMFSAFKRNIERQTAYFKEEFETVNPTHSQFVGHIQDSEGMAGTAGYADQYVCIYKHYALAMTLEGCNMLTVNDTDILGFNDGSSTKFCSQAFANVIAELMCEYF